MNNTNETVWSSGLEDVVAACTAISHVDGDRGELFLGGYRLEDLAGQWSFAKVTAHLLSRGCAQDFSVGEIEQRLFAGREIGYDIASRPDVQSSNAMDYVRLGLASGLSGDAKPAELIGAAGYLAAAWVRQFRSGKLVLPSASRTHAEDLLFSMTGDPGLSTGLSAALDAYLVTVIDHGMNASTFSARVIASTGSDLLSAILGALGALKGPLHGGAPGPVLDMLEAIRTPGNAQAFVEGELAASRRIMGMGHRIYRVRDPRAAVLEQTVAALGDSERFQKQIELARSVEAAAERALALRHPQRPLKANVEFFTAVLLDAIGIPKEAFTAFFAASRTAGWCAHVLEQQRVGKLIRPRSIGNDA